MAKRKKKANGTAKLTPDTFVVQPPDLATVSDVADYLREGFADMLEAVHDLTLAGVKYPEIISFDLANVTRAMADLLEGGAPLTFETHLFMFIDELSAAYTGLVKVLDRDQRDILGYDLPNGTRAEANRGTLPILAEHIEYAGRQAREEWESYGEQCMENRGRWLDLSFERARISWEMDELRPKKPDRDAPTA